VTHKGLFHTSLALCFAAALSAQTLPPAAQLKNGAPALRPRPHLTKFTFVVAGDNRSKKATDPPTQAMLDAISGIAAAQPAFVVWNGDTVFGKQDVGIASQYGAFLSAIGKIGVPVFNAPGNHEMVVQTNIPCGTASDPWSAELPDYSGSMAESYATAIGAPYGIFRHGNAAFIILNTDDVPDVAVPNACDYNGMVGQTQLTALTNSIAALNADATVAHIFFFMHRPIHDDNGSQLVAPAGTAYAARLAAFCSLLDTNANKKVTFVFASHDHRLWVYPTPSNPNGPFTRSVPSSSNPTFIVTGGAGAPLTGCPGTNGGPAGSYYHYLSVTVDGPNVTVDVKPLYGTTPCATAPPAQ
jgi:hypothetical protein